MLPRARSHGSSNSYTVCSVGAQALSEHFRQFAPRCMAVGLSQIATNMHARCQTVAATFSIGAMRRPFAIRKIGGKAEWPNCRTQIAPRFRPGSARRSVVPRIAPALSGARRVASIVLVERRIDKILGRFKELIQ